MAIKKRYNLYTAIAMVVGIVIGSGVFFKLPSVLEHTNGNLSLSLLAWLIGGLVMVVSAYTFALISSNCKKSSTIADMAEETVGRKHSYLLSWYYAIAYYPLLVGILGFVCADFTFILFGVTASPAMLSLLSFVYLAIMYIVNILAPKIAGYLQISTTIIKLIPLAFMAIVGVIYGLVSNNGFLIENLTSGSIVSTGKGFMAALCATCFAYEGWIVATSISKEVDNPKKTLPKALMIGTAIIILIYLLFFMGLAGTYSNMDFLLNGSSQIYTSFSKLFGFFGTLLNVFVIISCIGTLNGLCMGTSRSLKQIAENNNGPKPELFITIDKNDVNMPSALIGLAASFIWLAIWLTTVYTGVVASFDISELIIIFVYTAYIPMYVSIIQKRTDLNNFNRYVMPTLAIMAAVLMITAGIYAHGVGTLIFGCVVGTILFIGLIFYKEDSNYTKNNKTKINNNQSTTTEQPLKEVQYETQEDIVLMEDTTVVLKAID